MLVHFVAKMNLSKQVFSVIISWSVLLEIPTVRLSSESRINVLDCLNLLPAVQERLFCFVFVVTH